MKNDRIRGWTPLGLEDALDSGGIPSIARQSINCLSRDRHNPAICQHIMGRLQCLIKVLW